MVSSVIVGSNAPPIATTLEQADAIATHLANHKDTWVQVRIPERIDYLKQCIACVIAVSEQWAEAACRAKGIDPSATLAGEEWFVGPAITAMNLRLLVQALAAKGQPQPPKWMQRNGQAIAQVYPATLQDRLLLPGFTGEVWLEPGQPTSQGNIYRESTAGQLALVLGAGNVSAIAPMDALYKLFAENAVVLLKMNPVNEYMGPILEAAFAPLREAGFLEVVYGGAELGSYLCQHPLVDAIHITGSHHTHDAIVWGDTLTEQASRKAANQPFNPKPISSELGCVTPVLVVPGDWSDADLAFQAHNVAEMVVHNASCNCAAAKVVVTAKGWQQRDRFLQLLRQELHAIPPRTAYYPGSNQRYASFLERYPTAEPAPTDETAIPWTLIPHVPAQTGEYALTQEAFCGILAETSLDATDAGEFLRQAVTFANDSIWGNLSCTMLIDPTTQKRWQTELETAIANLHYGIIGVNVWSAVAFSLPMLPWGAAPGNTLSDIRSGQGFVHNTYLFDHPQKSVLRAPFRLFPKPIWFSQNQNLQAIARHFTAFQAKPNWGNLVKVAIAALQG